MGRHVLSLAVAGALIVAGGASAAAGAAPAVTGTATRGHICMWNYALPDPDAMIEAAHCLGIPPVPACISHLPGQPAWPCGRAWWQANDGDLSQ